MAEGKWEREEKGTRRGKKGEKENISSITLLPFFPGLFANVEISFSNTKSLEAFTFQKVLLAV